MTAQDRYRAMLRDDIAPALRLRGFIGSGATYVLPDDTHWLQLGFQASRWNSSPEVKFTVNMAIAEKAAWARLAAERGYASRPNPNTTYSPDIAARRLGTMAFGADRWWRVGDGATPTSGVVDSVLEAVDRVAIPLLRSRQLPTR